MCVWMCTSILFVISVLLFTATAELFECSADRLPQFGNTQRRNRPDHDKFQALVPAYKFQCSGKVTEWRACVEPGDKVDEHYYIQFQVWRPTGTGDGCYSLVDSNIPLDNAMEEEREISDSNIIIEAEGFLSPPGDDRSPLHRCVVLPVRQNQQIEVKVGDIVGYYVDHFRRGTDDRNDGGIQWIEDDRDVVVYYKDRLSKDALKSNYAIGGRNPTECGFAVMDNEGSYSLNRKHTALPVIGVTVTGVSITASASSVVKRTVVDVTTHNVLLSVQEPSQLKTFTSSFVTSAYCSTTVLPHITTASPSSPTESVTNYILIGLVVAVTIAVIATVTACILMVLMVRRRNVGRSPRSDQSHPTPSGVKWTVRREDNHCEMQSSLAVTETAENHPYATLEQREPPTYELPSDILEKECIDYTVIYEDPTSPSYVNEAYSNDSIFDSVGTWVPTLEARRNYDLLQMPSDEESYSNLKFFEHDPVFWAPASTTLGLYEQLSTKRYREINRNQICIVEQIGSGQFGMVSGGEWVYSGESMQIAVKTLKQQAGEGERVKFLQEAAIMGQFHHPNIIRLHGVVTVGDPILIILEYMPNGDLKSYLNNLVISHHSQRSLPRQFLKYGREIAAGMAYLSKKAFVHRDLAARNILLDGCMSCKVGDFGMARDLMDNTYYKSNGGMIPVKWTAPEAIFYKKYSTASDVWSYAMVLYEIWSVGHKPFHDLSNIDVIARGRNKQCLAAPSGCPRPVYSLMVDCWNPEPHLRPTFSEAYHLLQGHEDQLLHWSQDDISAKRHLLRASHIAPAFTDLQNKYMGI